MIPLVDCLVAPATCGAIADCLRILVASLLPCHCLVAVAVASPSPFRPPSSSSRPPSQPHEDSDGDGNRHRHRRSLSLPVLLPPPTPFFPPLSPLPPSPLSGCVRRGGRSGGAAAPAVIRDGPVGRTTKNRYGTASATASRRRLDDSLLRLADGILLSSIVATMALWRGGGGVRRPRRRRCLRSTSARCSLGGRIGRATTAAASRRRMTTTPTPKRGGTRTISWRSSSADFRKSVSGGGG